jgi:hypothetical protein
MNRILLTLILLTAFSCEEMIHKDFVNDKSITIEKLNGSSDPSVNKLLTLINDEFKSTSKSSRTNSFHFETTFGLLSSEDIYIGL